MVDTRPSFEPGPDFVEPAPSLVESSPDRVDSSSNSVDSDINFGQTRPGCGRTEPKSVSKRTQLWFNVQRLRARPGFRRYEPKLCLEAAPNLVESTSDRVDSRPNLVEAQFWPNPTESSPKLAGPVPIFGRTGPQLDRTEPIWSKRPKRGGFGGPWRSVLAAPRVWAFDPHCAPKKASSPCCTTRRFRTAAASGRASGR